MKKNSLAANLSLWVLLLFFDTEVFAQSDLPKSVQADLLQERIVAAARAQDYERMLSAISEYKALGIEIPTPLLFTEARAASALGQSERALAALKQYLKVAKREDQQYSDAIVLYGSLEKSTQAASLKRVLGQLEAQMKPLPGGQFVMGSDHCKRGDAGRKQLCGVAKDRRSPPYLVAGRYYWHADPAHRVTIKAFAIQTHTVSIDQFDAFAFATGRPRGNNCGSGSACVNFETAIAFVEWLSQTTGKRFRLPSEAEWEYAAVAGHTFVYPWGDCDVYSSTCSPASNAFGLSIGRSTEFVADCWHDNFVGAPVDGSAWDSTSCPSGLRVMRGSLREGGYFHRFFDRNTVAKSKEEQWNPSWVQYGSFRVVQDQ